MNPEDEVNLHSSCTIFLQCSVKHPNFVFHVRKKRQTPTNQDLLSLGVFQSSSVVIWVSTIVPIIVCPPSVC
ncbi:hypothetical protein L6452_20550 [Arctium lappa]|uniref:Uncharacterized protein n=1 Tax=Arctium lappa TaxID=4217 RepID=A0ACB9BCI0_ARCLA|nr:hypothetical protein L6452_20550 [Arctium lappa]